MAGELEPLIYAQLMAGRVTRTTGSGYYTIPTGPSTKISITAGVAAYGSWTQVTAATTADLFVVGVLASGGSGDVTQVQIGTGGAGAETVVSTLLYDHTQTTFPVKMLYAPIPVLSGVRIAARIAVDAGTTAFSLVLECINQADLTAG